MRLLILLTIYTVVVASTCKEYQVFKLAKLNWYAAFVDCLSRGLQLATVNSVEEQADLENAMKRANVLKEWLWLSGTDQNQEGNFVWMSTGEHVVYSKWAAGQPDNAGRNEHCMHVWSKGNTGITWNDWQCWNSLFYVCEKKPPCLPDIDTRGKVWSK